MDGIGIGLGTFWEGELQFLAERVEFGEAGVEVENVLVLVASWAIGAFDGGDPLFGGCCYCCGCWLWFRGCWCFCVLVWFVGPGVGLYFGLEGVIC